MNEDQPVSTSPFPSDSSDAPTIEAPAVVRGDSRDSRALPDLTMTDDGSAQCVREAWDRNRYCAGCAHPVAMPKDACLDLTTGRLYHRDECWIGRLRELLASSGALSRMRERHGRQTNGGR